MKIHSFKCFSVTFPWYFTGSSCTNLHSIVSKKKQQQQKTLVIYLEIKHVYPNLLYRL